MTRYVRGNTFPRKGSTTQSHRSFDDDSNELIPTSSRTTSLFPTESITSTSTMVPSSSNESSISAELATPKWDLNIRTLFDEVDTLDPATSCAIKALSLPDHPVLKMETIKTPSETLTKKLDHTVDTESKADTASHKGSKFGKSSRFRMSWDKTWYREPQTSEVKTRTRIRRSMTGFLKRRHVRSPSQPDPSFNPAEESPSPRWIDAASFMERDVADETDEFNWLKDNGLRRSDNESAKLWAGELIGRLR